MSRLLSLVSIAMLAASVGSLPQQIDKLMAVNTQLNSMAMGNEDDLLRAANASMTGQPQANPLEGLSAEQRQLIADASPEAKELASPLMTAMVKASKTGGAKELDAKRSVLAAYRAYQQNQAEILGIIWAAPALLLFLAGLLLLFGAKGASRVLAELCFSLSSKWLLLLSVGAAALYAVAKVNLWTALPHDLWGVPVAALLVAGGMLRIADFNYPVWNSTIGALIAPLLSCLIIVGCGRFGLPRF
jgi:hypothetical protein